MKKLPYKKILLALFAILLLMQFYRIDKTNPPVDASKDFIKSQNVPASMATMIKNACYDCHSHETKYPWYTNVMPFSWWIKGHIDHGREKLNFSEWTDYASDDKIHNLKEAAETLVETRMPLASYLIGHPEARISKEERKQLAEWFEQLQPK